MSGAAAENPSPGPSPERGGEKADPAPSPPSPVGKGVGGLGSSSGRGPLVVVVAVPLVALAVGLLIWLASPGPTDELTRLAGEWRVGRPGDRPDASPGMHRVRITREADGTGRWTYVVGDQETSTHRVTVNPAARPAEIDLTPLEPDGRPRTFTDGPGKGTEMKQLGVYVLDGDTLRVALAPAQEGRRPPTPADPDAQVLVLTRVR